LTIFQKTYLFPPCGDLYYLVETISWVYYRNDLLVSDGDSKRYILKCQHLLFPAIEKHPSKALPAPCVMYVYVCLTTQTLRALHPPFLNSLVERVFFNTTFSFCFFLTDGVLGASVVIWYRRLLSKNPDNSLFNETFYKEI
jgi:hypothetical protein